VEGSRRSDHCDIVLDAIDAGGCPGGTFGDLALIPGMNLAAQPDGISIGDHRDGTRIEIGIAFECRHNPLFHIARRRCHLYFNQVGDAFDAVDTRSEILGGLAVEMIFHGTA
jgi:hypothetical protein